MELIVLIDGCQSSKEMIFATCHTLIATEMIHRKGNLVALFPCIFNYINYQCSEFDEIVRISIEGTLVIPTHAEEIHDIH